MILSGALASSAALALAVGVAPAQPAGDEDHLAERLVAAAVERTRHAVRYDGTYRRIPYPGGDVPEDVGVCTDLVVRAYRSGLDLDLQRLVHDDMVAAFADYPVLWGLRSPDSNIDHRRVPNLETFLRRHGAVLPVSAEAGAYRSGDLVTWRLPRNLPHIGIVADRRTPDGARPLVVHNIGLGPRIEDALFAFQIVGHFRYLPAPEPVVR